MRKKLSTWNTEKNRSHFGALSPSCHCEHNERSFARAIPLVEQAHGRNERDTTHGTASRATNDTRRDSRREFRSRFAHIHAHWTRARARDYLLARCTARCAFPFADRNRVVAVKLAYIRRCVSFSQNSVGRARKRIRGDDKQRMLAVMINDRRWLTPGHLRLGSSSRC